MRASLLACLATLVVVTSLAEPAEAGRRRRRRAAVAVGVVAATTRRPTVVVAAPRAATVVAAPVAAQRAYVVVTPDLTISETSVEGDLLCITVKNIGQAAAPETLLRIDFRQVAGGVLVATKRLRVLPLRVNQSIRFRLHKLPLGPVEASAAVDPDHQVAEGNEQNNELMIEIAAQPPAVDPAPLDDVDVWVVP